jgi:hypothetical protein
MPASDNNQHGSLLGAVALPSVNPIVKTPSAKIPRVKFQTEETMIGGMQVTRQARHELAVRQERAPRERPAISSVAHADLFGRRARSWRRSLP